MTEKHHIEPALLSSLDGEKPSGWDAITPRDRLEHGPESNQVQPDGTNVFGSFEPMPADEPDTSPVSSPSDPTQKS
jgi:hypothetical protein